MLNSVTWKIGGEAGFGIMSSGVMLAKTHSRAGYYTLSTNEYPSLIRGGHNLITVRLANHKIEAMNKDVHILVALNKQTVELHKDELNEKACIIFDPKDYEWKENEFKTPVTLISVPLSEIVTNLKGSKVMRNTVALGASLALLGEDFGKLEEVISDQFKKKGQEVIDSNITLAKAGYDHVKKTYSDVKDTYIAECENKERLLNMNASEAVGLGAVRGGLKFAAIYPMTPINSIITFLAAHTKKLNIVYKQPEDEISGIHMALGASAAGVRSMVATSGGGFALMTEGLSLCGNTELPLVINLGMRVGPASGMPTWSEQGELQFVIHAGHGEFPRIILAPGDAEECYTLTVDAFNLAAKYQVPVFILTDKYLAESHWCVRQDLMMKDVQIDHGKVVKEEELPEDGSFKRYNLDTDDGVSPRSYFGMKNGFYIANSYEHDEQGFVIEDSESRIKMADKRMKKFTSIMNDLHKPTVYGDDDAEITFITWGSSKGPTVEAMKMLQEQGKKAQVVHLSWVYPFPTESMKEILSKAKRVIDVEQNPSGQLASLIREHTGVLIEEKILKYDGRPFYPEEIVEKV
ncbi:2-oxoacid:acceptor oxidoreductase subunit alpha [Patescibacteria group bacterium]